MRRLPIYFLVDISGASDINKLNMCLLKILLYIREDPYMLETAYISIITIGDTAKIALSLTDIYGIKAIPIFHTEKGMALGKALNLLMDDIDKNVVKTTIERKGDMKPIIFLFANGMPTGNITLALKKWNRNFLYKSTLVSVARKNVAKLLEPISNCVLPQTDLTMSKLPDFFYKIVFWPVEASLCSSQQEYRDNFNRELKEIFLNL
ncbi:hypothetical protein LDZ44_22060 [Bacteroides xylanisolvens]|uniref:VWFA domain-containing protein n=1 Tax=Bacteroides xylanisolvens TaxID=371601 RepID=A0AAW4SS47_9BACE|nr:hypothetical protein [Bacteroides xylanisolvens]MCA4467705.1 hypothetical protein [Bacteroides xylanisolvens]MCA4472462.1 hypothetical protein [Bacteroides xylanisolvens]MCA4481613.1 hypothetical protein [Bacteroides xylanisolvens]MCA4490855.1 hypothetical protein [Bacteroides xylanisolvens]MCA4495229.1 hypothetical protein [Bacteroides xylanisolvens]